MDDLNYPQNKADLERCNRQLAEICSGDRKLAIMSVPPKATDFDMQFSTAFDELKAYRDTGLTPEEIKTMRFKQAYSKDAAIADHYMNIGLSMERLDALAEADRDGRIVLLDTCGSCVNYTGAGDFDLCCMKSEKRLCYRNTDAKGCKSYAPRAEAEAALGKEQKE